MYRVIALDEAPAAARLAGGRSQPRSWRETQGMVRSTFMERQLDFWGHGFRAQSAEGASARRSRNREILF
jgi:hypothetical protein